MEGIIIFITVVIALFLSKVFKLFFYKSVKEAMLAGGGMPSSHSASVVALLTSVFLFEGFSILFMVTLSFSVVVLVDAMRVRYVVGHNALILKKHLPKKLAQEIKVEQGHTFKEVVYGSVLGFLVAVIMFLVV